MNNYICTQACTNIFEYNIIRIYDAKIKLYIVVRFACSVANYKSSEMGLIRKTRKNDEQCTRRAGERDKSCNELKSFPFYRRFIKPLQQVQQFLDTYAMLPDYIGLQLRKLGSRDVTVRGIMAHETIMALSLRQTSNY